MQKRLILGIRFQLEEICVTNRKNDNGFGVQFLDFRRQGEAGGGFEPLAGMFLYRLAAPEKREQAHYYDTNAMFNYLHAFILSNVTHEPRW